MADYEGVLYGFHLTSYGTPVDNVIYLTTSELSSTSETYTAYDEAGNTIGNKVYYVGGNWTWNISGSKYYVSPTTSFTTISPTPKYIEELEDLDGNVYIIKDKNSVTSVNNVSPVDGNVTLSIPSEVTETTVSGWGFTKNAGTVTTVNNTSPDDNGNVAVTANLTSANAGQGISIKNGVISINSDVTSSNEGSGGDMGSKGLTCITETYTNGTSGYRIWSDNYCEQWGQTNIFSSLSGSDITISFLKEFSNTNYILSLSKYINGTSTITYYGTSTVTKNAQRKFDGYCEECTTSSIKFPSEASASGGDVTYSSDFSYLLYWKASGYLKTTSSSSSSDGKDINDILDDIFNS